MLHRDHVQIQECLTPDHVVENHRRHLQVIRLHLSILTGTAGPEIQTRHAVSRTNHGTRPGMTTLSNKIVTVTDGVMTVTDGVIVVDIHRPLGLMHVNNLVQHVAVVVDPAMIIIHETRTGTIQVTGWQLPFLGFPP